ncbi:MAG: methionyl-tRNA formyltransferase, methionyl-tRNA formyltransferase [Candidatus Nomurabacteria bacterium]|nr:methionyl-tRNA formyltransferase, methionyl-tRNA formyltransferase [Candidatus Nomurabacteria bacterium]
MKYAFFGTPHIAALSLESLKEKELLPSLIVTAPARPQGRGLHLVETPVAVFGKEHDVSVITPEKISPEVIQSLIDQGPWDFFLVVAYGKILPTSLLEIVDNKVLNLHPSLLPKYRGPSPLESVLLSDDKETGVTIMQLDKLVDHGPIVAQSSFELSSDTTLTSLTEKSAALGIELFANSIEKYLSKELVPTEQDHDSSTHTRKYIKADGLITDDMSSWDKWKIFRALGERGWVHFMIERHGEMVQVKITKASYEDEAFVIEEVIPENGKRQSYTDLLHSLN